jgi:hypothetical protein
MYFFILIYLTFYLLNILMDTSKYTWNGLLFYIDILVQKGSLTEEQLEKIIDMADIKKVVKNNVLSDDFINKHIVPRIDYDDYDGIDLYDIEKYQQTIRHLNSN